MGSGQVRCALVCPADAGRCVGSCGYRRARPGRLLPSAGQPHRTEARLQCGVARDSSRNPQSRPSLRCAPSEHRPRRSNAPDAHDKSCLCRLGRYRRIAQPTWSRELPTFAVAVILPISALLLWWWTHQNIKRGSESIHRRVFDVSNRKVLAPSRRESAWGSLASCAFNGFLVQEHGR